MLETPESAAVAKLPLAPKIRCRCGSSSGPYGPSSKAFRSSLDAGGPVTRLVLGPKWLLPTAVLIASPQGVRDVLGRNDEIADRGGTITTIQMHRLMGGNLLDLPHQQWLPRRRTLQPMFTKERVARYAGHMAAAAQTVVDGWGDGATIDLDTECAHPARARPLGTRPGPRRQRRPLPRRATGAGIDHRSRSAYGQTLSDDQICHELVLFILAGHDTTSTTLTYSLWALGHHPAIQDRVFDE